MLAVEPLVVRDLRVRFGHTTAVDGVDVTVGEGSVVAIVGRNGCGKTSTIRAIVGLVAPASGRVAVEGFAAGSIAARARIAYVPDEPTGLDELTVREHGDLIAALWRADIDFRRRRDALLGAFRLDDRHRRQLGALSHGQRRLVAIATAAALRPTLLVVDEATAALDPEAVLVLREIVAESAGHGVGVLLATQDLAFVDAVCERVVVLDQGRVAAAGTLDRVRARFAAATLEEAFAAAVGSAGRVTEVRNALAR